MTITQIKKQDLNMLKKAHEQRKINTIVKNSHEIQNLIDDGEIKNVQIHEDSISYEPDYKKKFDRLTQYSLFLLCLFLVFIGWLFGKLS